MRVKDNQPRLLESLAGECGIDICSPNELDRALECGFAARDISFTGTGVSNRDLARLLYRLEDAESVETVLGLEGQGAALYFGEFGRFLKADPTGRGFDFTARNRRPPRDPVNALL